MIELILPVLRRPISLQAISSKENPMLPEEDRWILQFNRYVWFPQAEKILMDLLNADLEGLKAHVMPALVTAEPRRKVYVDGVGATIVAERIEYLRMAIS
jgi:hypothetical protein